MSTVAAYMPTRTSIEQIANQYLPQNSRPVSSGADQLTSFADILKGKYPEWQTKTEENSGLHFSKHATKRLDERDISLSAEQSDRLTAGVQRAGEKGISDSLVIVDSLAFIVNVPSQTVVTAMDQTETMDGNIFTNIDGAVIA